MRCRWVERPPNTIYYYSAFPAKINHYRATAGKYSAAVFKQGRVRRKAELFSETFPKLAKRNSIYFVSIKKLSKEKKNANSDRYNGKLIWEIHKNTAKNFRNVNLLLFLRQNRVPGLHSLAICATIAIAKCCVFQSGRFWRYRRREIPALHSAKDALWQHLPLRRCGCFSVAFAAVAWYYYPKEMILFGKDINPRPQNQKAQV